MSIWLRVALFVSSIAAIVLVGCVKSDAAPKHRRQQTIITCNDRGCTDQAVGVRTSDEQGGKVYQPHVSGDPRPGRWCAWYLRRELGIPKSSFRPYEYNLARAFRYIGSRASGPAVGVIVVWRHHVGIITGRTDDGWIVKSGNDGGAVRERERSMRGVIAYRWPHSGLALNE